eukprot:NODE_13363_length_1170_cov_4.484180.p1 GENE.NODE_13363_length_1170_cov_4.484180~~NODE_13363_length_1170_cov_4.484180.p1  ORF type:complete len:348 (+),score=22.15 NODE_13363_length_1170_cov_4.484180:1-1044(+)
MLKANIDQRVAEAMVKLAEVGEVAVDGQLMIKTCQDACVATLVPVQEAVSEAVLKFQQEIHATKDQLSKEWSSEKLKPNVFECPLFSGNAALRACMADVTKWWGPISTKLVVAVANICAESIPNGVSGPLSCGVPLQLRSCIGRQWAARHSVMVHDLESVVIKTLAREPEWGTVNHYFTAKFSVERAFPEECIDKFIQSLQESDWSSLLGMAGRSVPFGAACSSDTRISPLDTVRANIRTKLESQKACFEKRFEAMSLHEQQQDRLFDAVKALWSVEHKSYIDIVLKDLRASILVPYEQWIRAELLIDEEISKNAVENQETRTHRQHWKDVLTKMRRCAEELEKICW